MVFRVIVTIIIFSLPVLLTLSIVFFVKYFKKKEKKNLVKGIIFISSFALIIMGRYILYILMFVCGSFARVGMFGSGDVYYYPYHEYNYYVNADYNNLGKDETIKREFPGFEIWYGIDSSYRKEVIEPNGDMILLKGPPFDFQIFFPRVSRNIDYFYFKEFIFQVGNDTDTVEEYNLLNFDDIKMDIEFSRYNKYNVKGEDNALEIFRDTGKINISRLVTLGRNWLEDDIEEIKRRVFNDEYKNYPDDFKAEVVGPENTDIDKLLNDGVLYVKIRLSDLPIDYKNNENIVIRFALDVVFNDSEVNNFVFDDVYKRKYRYEEESYSYTPPKSFGKDKGR
jgi:hypothetical protein